MWLNLELVLPLLLKKPLTIIYSLNFYYRRYAVKDMESRAVLERMYIYLEHQLRLYTVWIKLELPPTMLAVAIAITISAFVSICYTDLPPIIYLVYPNTAFTLMLMIFWICYDGVRIMRASGEVIDGPRSANAGYLRPSSRAMRMQVLKRAKVMREIEFAVGEFTIVTLNLPIAVWEEILNQVLFLLSF